MHDSLIRKSFHKKVLNKFHKDRNSRVIDEFAIDHGVIRADIAIANGILHGFEIKGDYDKLNRLPSQAKSYSSIFDKVTLIVSEKHLKESLKIIPRWWEVYLVREGKKGAIHFSVYREGKLNSSINLFLLAKILWRSEAIQLLKKIGADKSLLRKNRRELYKVISKKCCHTQLRDYVCYTLKTRQYWKGHSPLLLSGD